MNSNAHCRCRRLLGRVAASSTILVLGLLSTEFLFPTVPAAPYASLPGADFQRLLLVIALVVALATFAGAVITTALAWLAKWKEREEDATLAPDGRFGLAAEPANERLRALRAVISPLEENQAREP